MLLDPETFDLVQHVDTVLGAITGSEFEAHVHPELMQSVLEVATPVCRTPADVEHALRQLRAYVTRIAQEQGLRVGSSGTHPFSLFERQRITARDRYRNLIDQMQYVARRELIFGLHVHVAVGGSGHRDPGRERPPLPARVVARALGELAVLARRADGTRRRRGRWSSRRSRARARRRASATTPTTRRSSASSRRRAASRTTRTSGGTSGRIRGSARSRCASATRSRGSRTPSPSPPTSSAWSSCSPSGTRRARRFRPITASSRPRTSGSRAATAWRLP